MALQRLKEASERAKHELSIAEESRVTLPFISADASGTPKHLNTVLTRREFEKMVEDLIQKTIDPVNDAMEAAGVTAKQIDEVVLVGGQTRMPRVIEAVKQVFGKEPNRNINPDEVVAVGAAIQGGILRGDIKDMVLLDVTPLSLGIETHGGLFTKLIERNSTIPTKNSLVFTTVSDNQNKVQVAVLQGEREFARENKSLGKFDLVGIPPAPRGVPQVEVIFDIDANGMLHVVAKDKATNKEQSIRITSSSGLSKDEVEKMKHDAQAHASEDKKRKDEIDTKNQADNLVFQTRKQLKEFGEKMPANFKSKVETSADELETAIKGGNISEIKAKMESLNAAWNEASGAMYQSATAGAPGGGGTPPPSSDGGPSAGGPEQKGEGKAVEDASFEVVDDKDKK
jgi:molecular chaperone DnaK